MIYEKLLEVQKELGAIKKDSTNPYFKSKYFDINALLEHVKPVLNKHDLVITQALTTIEGRLGLETILAHKDGESYKTVCPIPEMVTEIKNKEKEVIGVQADPQKQGSAITYYRRYALQSLLALEATDDDGNTASSKVDDSGLPF